MTKDELKSFIVEIFNELTNDDKEYKPTVFLGGTCNDSQWREQLIPLLKCKYYNPVVPDWTPECQQEEIRQREICDYVLYVITPKMTGVYSIAEVVHDSCFWPEKTLFCYLTDDNGLSFTEGQIKSLQMTEKMIQENGAMTFKSLEEIAEYINNIDYF